MSKFKPVLNLSVDNLQDRRETLEAELNKVVVEIINTTLVKEIKELFEKAGVVGAETISWEFHPESDDEGGTDMHISYLRAYDADGEKIELDEFEFVKKYKWSDGSYSTDADSELYDLMYNYRDDLFENDIEEILL